MVAVARIAVRAALAAGIAASMAAHAADEPEPLVLTPENTVVVDGSVYAGQLLHYMLLKAVARADDADAYAPFTKAKPDRAASPVFPLVRAAKAATIAAGKNVLAVGRTPHLSEADRQRLAETPGSMLLRRQGNVVVIAADRGNPWGAPFSAVSAFLDQCAGVRQYAPGDLWLSRSPSRSITIAQLDVFRKPALASVSFSYPGKQSFERNRIWQLMSQPLSHGATLRANHALAGYFDPAKHYPTHPEIYEMKDGKRPRPTGGAWNPCLSAKALPDIAMAEIRAQMAKRPRSYFSFGVMDCAFDCQCPDCQRSVRTHGGSYSNLYYTFLNQVARQCQKEFPGLYLTAYVYSNVRTPPVGMRIEPNIVIDSVIKSYHFVDPAWLEHEKARIRRFSDLGAKWLTHDWCFSGVSPRSYLRQYALFLQWAAHNGMLGIYIEWSGNESWYLDGAKYWILRRLLSDPYQDVAALWRRYCDDMYGDGGEAMFQLFAHFADKYAYSDRTIERCDIPRQEFVLFTADDLAYQRTLIARAMELTKDDPLIQQRFAAFNRYFRAHELFARATGDIARIHHRHTVLDKRTDLNREALAWYLNEEGSLISEAIDYYQTKRTLPPDTNSVAHRLGALPSYIANYSRAIGPILLAIRRQASREVDLSKPDPKKVQAYVATCKRILRENCPKAYRRDNLPRFERMLGKALWVPRGKALPSIDGDLADPAWRGAAVIDHCTVRDILLPSKHQTTGKVLRVGDALAIGLTCRQAGPIWARTTPDVHAGTRIWRESGVEFFLGPVGTGDEPPPFAQYIVNALGAFRGFALAKDNRDGLQVAVKAAEGIYTIEAILPLKAKGYDLTAERTLSFNLMRNVFTSDTFSGDELIGWHPIFTTAQRPQSRGLLFLE